MLLWSHSNTEEILSLPSSYPFFKAKNQRKYDKGETFAIGLGRA